MSNVRPDPNVFLGVGPNNNVLDVYRVEQRLKYLGFPAMGYVAPGSTNTNQIQDFVVDGSFERKEYLSAVLFQQVINGTADGIISQNGTAWKWLNAYNAPHWMDLGTQMENSSLPGWNNLQNDSQGDHKDVEHYGTSWTRDLMRAKTFALDAFLANIPATGSRFRGAVDANHGITPTTHTSHGDGMNFDLSINVSYLTGVFLTSSALAGPAIDTNLASRPTNGLWSNQYVLDINNPVGLNGPRAVLPNTRIDKDNFNYQINALYDFLSLYSVTRDNGAELNGWDDLQIANGDPVQKETIRKALFGDGTASGSLIKSVAVGGTGTQNPLVRIGQVLSALGVPPNVTPSGVAGYAIPAHHNHFHLNIQPPTKAPVAIVASNNLFAAEATTMTDVSPIFVAASPIAAQGNYDAVYSVCKNMVPVDHKDFSLANGISGASGTVSYFMLRGQQELDTKSWRITLLEDPKHGKLVPDIQEGGYMYHPEVGYLGIDQMTFVVEAQGKKIKEIYSVHVGKMAPEYGPCPDYGVKELPNSTKDGGNGSSLDILELPTDGPLDAEAFAKLHSMVSFSMGAGILGEGGLLNFADLPAGALGQTTGTSITLDDNAAGHNWFIDTTPADNSEFLPTSNPYEWVAKEGSAAYGKMDMLSVLLHEYGHALGIDHSVDGHDYMATTLTAGVRRLPSAEELALMQQLVGEVKTTLSPSPLPGGGEGQNGPSQLPLLPLGGFGLAFLGRLRGTRYGSLNVEADLSTLVTQFDVSANAKLTNGNFSVASGMPVDNGWATQGSVDFVGGAATLKETSTSQTRLNQVFVVNPRDRFLSFTIAGSVLDDVNGAPDDAFEAALLDANTGLSLAGALSLTRTDAMLNIQADGTETAASGVTRVTNGDGSRTYRVDLAGIAAGTAVNLSFDLIGFGKDNSEVTIRDVRVSGLPELHDDAATMNEDGTLAFDPFAQVDNAALLQLGSHVVDQPAHGSVTVNPDGTFAYTPAADYFGTDTFTYRLNDGPLESNLATVTVSVTAVNDAPVAADVYATLAEDTPLVINLGQAQGLAPTGYVTDVDSAMLTIQIVAGPSHGVLLANADGSYTYTPDANYNGLDSFTYKANDGQLDSNVASVNLNIIPVNDAPVANDVAVYTLEDNQLVLNLLGSASDVDSNILTASIVTAPAHGVLIWNTDGSYTYTPEANYNGTDSFTYIVNDAAFAGDPSALDSNIATVSLTIGSVNDAPEGMNNTVTTLEDTAYVFQLADFGYSDTNDLVGAQASRLQADGTSAIQWDNFTAVTIGSLPASGMLMYNGVAVVAGQRISVAEIAAGLLKFAPAANANGTAYANFTFQVQDDGGTANGGIDTDLSARTMSIDVTAVNDAPVAVDLNFTTDEDTPITLNLLASVVDIDSAVLTPILIAGPQHGQLIQNADGSFNYLAYPDYFGSDSFTYKVNDAAVAGDASALDSNIVTVSLTINAVNDAPVAISSAVTSTEDTPYVFSWSDFRVRM